ncbi:putative dna directed rna polymerase ii 15 kda protein [Phaeoacremonium minimum UCRPA7]|uniref:Putative dna directed rna polymerase ii 15 kDa protein n=1 Tax=Phaeoacremonium minimum (strain UCR-PA7) TaxID=1286976 RepID=R8BKG2_PHAM7|nr:putative dna directed rna polymerase ii 15 kda protein [Phaeoacremonium minimum UCRPA7]EON99707.1 putative dna directed rna polymerase ii 15 kda protein [Phaeoacremonium minimum UCRPA7]
MASPQSATSQDGADTKKNLEQITFRFCSECSNMLYPKEDEDSHKLQFTCRTCQYTEEATSTCVFRNVLNNAAGETAGVTQDVGSDPTDVECSICGVNPAMTLSPPSTSIATPTPSSPSDCTTLDELFALHDVYMPDPDAMLDMDFAWDDCVDKGNDDREQSDLVAY